MKESRTKQNFQRNEMFLHDKTFFLNRHNTEMRNWNEVFISFSSSDGKGRICKAFIRHRQKAI